MSLNKEFVKLNYKKKEFEILYHSYICEDTKQQFTTDELDNINLAQVHDQYKEKYGFPAI